jgi:hypothetical protein
MAALCLSSLVAFSPGCASEEDVQSSRAETVQEREKLNQSIATLEQQRSEASAAVVAQDAALHDTKVAVAKMPDGPEKVAAQVKVQEAIDQVASIQTQIKVWTEAIDKGKATSQALSDRIVAGDAILATVNQPSPSVQLISTVAGGFNPIVGMLTAVIGGLGVNNLRLSRSKNAYKGKATKLADGGANIVRSIDVLAGMAPEVALALSKYKDQLRLIQNGTGAKILDLVKGNAKVTPEAVVAAA